MKSSLNHIYRSIWSEVLNAWVAVSELTSAKGKRSGSSVLNAVLTASAINARNSTSRKLGIKLVTLALACCFSLNAAQANPVGAQVVNGTAAISQIGNTLTVSNSPNAIINWQGFSINAGETTRFVQQSASSAVLNRVVGADPSQLLGTLASNGKVFLINPNGILVGQGARIDVAGLVASTLNISNEDFLAGKLNFGATLGAGGIQNFGAITTPEGGTVYLVAPQVDNQGIITPPRGETILAAGNTVQLLDTGTPGVTVQVTGADNTATNIGQILADSGRIGMVGAVVKNSGTLSANSLVSEGGRVFLKASKDIYVEKNARIEASGTQGGSIEVLGNRVAVTDNASLDASGQNGGGAVLLGGDYQGKNPDIQKAAITYFGANASIKADALNNGNGGKVILWADDTTRAYGSISVRGGAAGGNGGFVETSGHRYLDVTRAPDIAAPQGRSGAWLLDPESITISSSASTNNTGTAPFKPAAAGSSSLSDAVLRAALVAGGTVTVDTTGGGAGVGNILVDITANLANIGVGAGAILNLKAHNDITVNSSITATGLPLATNLIADQDLNNSGAVFVNAALNSNGGNVNVTSFGNILLNAGTTNIMAGAGTVNLTSAGGSIQGDPGGAPLDISAASVVLNAATGISANGGAAQFYVDAGSVSFSNSGSGLVRIYNNHAAASSFSGSNAGGSVILESSDSANPTSVGNVSAGGDIVFRMNTININNPINAGINKVFLSTFAPNSAVSINGSAAFDLTGAELSNITANKIVVGNDNFGNYALTADIGTLAAVNITNFAKLEVVAPTITMGAGGFINTAGSLALQTDSFVSGGGAINVGAAGSVMISGKNKTQIDLGGVDAAGVLGLSAAGVGAITADKLFIGDLFTTSMLVSSPISLAATTLSLTSGTGGISGPGALTVANLAIRSIGSVDLGTSYSSVSNVAASVGDFTTPNNPNFKLKNSTALNVGANIDGLSGISISISGTYNSASPDGVIALSSINSLTQSAGALLAGKAVYAEGSNVNLTLANPTGKIAGKATGTSASDGFSYTSSNGIAVTTVNGFSGISAVNAANPHMISLAAGGAGISQDPTAAIVGLTTDLLLNTTGTVDLGTAANNVAALGTAVSAGQFNFYNNSALTLGVWDGVSYKGIFTNTANQPVNITANGLLTVRNAVNAGTGSVALEAPDIQIGVTAVAGTTIDGGFIKLRTNKVAGAAGTISSAGTSASTLTSGTGIVLETDNFNFPGFVPVLNAAGEVAFRTFTDNRSITIGNSCNAADPSCLLISGANINAPEFVIGNDVVADLDTTENIHVDIPITLPAGRVALLSGGTVSQSTGAVITALDLGVSAGGVVNLKESNMVTNLVGRNSSGAFSFINGQSLNIATMSGGVSPHAYSVSGITAAGALTVQTTGAASHITLNSPVSSAAVGDAVVLAAGGNFINNAGNAAISAPNGRWLVYATNPANNVFGGLNSNNTAVWNTTFAGTPPANVTQIGNRYLFSYQPTVTFTSLSTSKTYGIDATTTVASAYSVSGLNAGVTNAYLLDTNAIAFSGAPTVTSSGSLGTAAVAGSPYAINIAQGGLSALNGYALAYSSAGVLTVNTAPLTITANVASKTYDGLAYSGGNGVVYTGFVNSETSAVLGGALAYSGTSQGAVNAGSYLIAPGGLTSGNYNISYTDGALMVNPAALTVTASNAAKTYGATKTYLGTEFTPVGLANSETIGSVTLTSTGDAPAASVLGGPYAINASAASGGTFTASNYTINYISGTLTVNPAALTVTASNAAKTYGATKTYLGTEFTPVGLVNSETIGSVTLTSTGDAPTASVLGGPYAINASAASGGTFTASNYTISYTNGALTVNPAALTVAANGFTKTYDGLAYSGGNGVTYTGLVNGESSTVLGGALAYGGSSQGAIDTGNYLITPGGLTSSNYTIGYVDGALAVVPPITPATIEAVVMVTTVPPAPPTPPPPPPPPPPAPVVGDGVGGTTDTFGGGEPSPPAAKKDDNAKKDDKDKKDDKGKNDETNPKDDNSNKGKKNAKTEKC